MMRLVLKDFQASAIDLLVTKLRGAARDFRTSGETQAVGLSSPTGSGKTIMVTASMERILEGDSDHQAVGDAVFLWITDQPQLNEQTRRKMVKDSSLFNEGNLVTIGSSFDQEMLTPGTVNFLNIQKLGRERELIAKGDERDYTIWETLTNTIERMGDRLHVIIDEAHRGMREGTVARSEANTIIQKFIKGSPGEIPPIPLITGISATLERFNKLVSGTGRTMRPVDIPVDLVRASGLLKEVVTLYHPDRRQPTDITMLLEAMRSWQKFRHEWQRYCREQGEVSVKPIIVVQVQDAAGKRASKTDLDEAVNAIEREVIGLPVSAFAHAFQEGSPLLMGGKEIRYLAPSDINGDPDVQVVFFKASLNTGWDCPRAEVIMSFRTAHDATSIAQLVGRMVRSPLARRIEAGDFLNSVSLYLPHYDERGVKRVIERLTSPDPDTIPPIEFRRGQDQVQVTRASASGPFFEAIERLPSYIIPTQRKASQVRRLMKLARALANDEIKPEADDGGLTLLVAVLQNEYKRVRTTEMFNQLVRERSRVTIRALDWQVGLDVAEEGKTITLDLATENIDDLFEAAGRHIGDEGLHKEWWKHRRRQGADNTLAKLELVALSIDAAVRRNLEATAQTNVGKWLKAYNRAISALPERQRQVYDEVRAQALDPELCPISLPQEMSVPKAVAVWRRHLYVDSDGKYPADLNKWESAVVDEELKRDRAVMWLRNVPRKAWAITIPYEMSGKAKPFYPDFLFLRKSDGEFAVDLLDPHHIDLADAPAKAAGLAKYAAKHAAAFNRIELIIVSGSDRIQRIDLTDEAKREKVLAVRSKEHLHHLFDEMT